MTFTQIDLEEFIKHSIKNLFEKQNKSKYLHNHLFLMMILFRMKYIHNLLVWIQNNKMVILKNICLQMNNLLLQENKKTNLIPN